MRPETKDLDIGNFKWTQWEHLEFNASLKQMIDVCTPVNGCSQGKSTDNELVLSTIASFYDTIRFMAPFMPEILHELNRDKVNWDKDLLKHILPQW